MVTINGDKDFNGLFPECHANQKLAPVFPSFHGYSTLSLSRDYAKPTKYVPDRKALLACQANFYASCVRYVIQYTTSFFNKA